MNPFLPMSSSSTSSSTSLRSPVLQSIAISDASKMRGAESSSVRGVFKRMRRLRRQTLATRLREPQEDVAKGRPKRPRRHVHARRSSRLRLALQLKGRSVEDNMLPKRRLSVRREGAREQIGAGAASGRDSKDIFLSALRAS